MKFEFSAGGIVYRREKTRKDSSLNNTKIEVLVAQHSQHHGWVFPKGLIDKGEEKQKTALREVKEETGIEANIEKELEPVEYWYHWKGNPSTGSGQEKIKKTVYYFLMSYISGETNDHDFEMENVEWIDEKDVENRLTYKSDKKVWQVALKILNLKF